MNNLVSWIDRKFYPGVEGNWDDAMFRERLLEVIDSRSVILDLGAGAGIVQQMNFRNVAAKVCGIDLDQRVTDNPMLDEGRIADAARIPYPDEIFDVVFADNVLEHLPDPVGVFSEVARVLKPGGRFLFKTPNKWHYMPIIARLTPHAFHQWVNRKRGRAEVDTFPTLYRANSVSDIRMLARQTGFDVIRTGRLEGRPEYLRINFPVYLAGLLYERIVSSTELLAMFRILLIGELQKPE